jgi:hypothetical protein
MSRWRHLLMRVMLLACGACPAAEEGGEICDARLHVRVPTPNPLLGTPESDLARVTIEREGAVAFDETVQLFAIASGGIVVDVVDADGKRPAIAPSADLQLALRAFSSQGPTTVAAIGSTGRFACPAAEDRDIPLYLGPANGFGTTATAPAAARIGAAAVVLDDARVLLVGGESGTGAAVPTSEIYDHTMGRFCGTREGCLTNDIPARIHHTATALADGSVLIFGGRTPGATAALNDVYRFDPLGNAFAPLSFTGNPLQTRAQHAAVLLSGTNAASDLRGNVIVAGGCASDCTSPADVLADALLLDPVALTVTTVAMPRRAYGASASMLASGKVLLAGGRLESGTPSSELTLFDSASRSFAGPAQPCAGADIAHLCANRADHVAVLLDDDNVLLFGGSTSAVAGVPVPPVAEVFLLATESVVPVADPRAELVARRGHAAAALRCASPPCPVLITGGAEVGDPTRAAPALLFYPAAGSSPSAYAATLSVSARSLLHNQRADHVAAPLSDGTLLVTGGTDPTAANVPVLGAAIFSMCTPTGSLSCPAL